MALEAKHEAFTAWAGSQGVVINGIAPAKLPEKGIGIVATRKLKKGETIISIPASTLITLDSDFVRQAGISTKVSVYGTVAAALTVNHGNEERWYAPWQEVWPSVEDLEKSMPLCWGEDLRKLLPPAAKDLLKHQEGKYTRDFEAVKAQIAENLRSWYRYYWLIVNTRCFYWEYFKRARDAKKRGRKLGRDECLMLCPWADYFNHAESGCPFQESPRGGAVVCDRNYAEGEEVVVSYGAHSNDYLLVEYGFVLAENKHDSTKLDDFVLPLLTTAQSTLLEQHSYLGNYAIDDTGLCYRTQVAVRTMVTSNSRMQDFLAGEYDGAKEESKMVAKYELILNACEDETETAMRTMENVTLEDIFEDDVAVSAMRALQNPPMTGPAVDVLKVRCMQISNLFYKAWAIIHYSPG